MAAKAADPASQVASRRRWIVWGVLNAALFLSFFHRLAPAVIADKLMLDFQIGAAAVGALAGIYFYVYMAMQIPSGMLADTLGPRKTVAAGSLLAALGALLFAVAPDLPAAFVGRLLVGMGTAVGFICALKIVAAWFRPAEFATLAGLGSLVTTAGSATAATPLALAAEAFGWRAALAAAAAPTLGVAALVWWLVRDRPPGQPAGGSPRLGLRQAASLVWRNPQTWLCFLAHFGWFGSYLAFVGLWGVPYLMHVHGLDRLAAANLMIGAAVAYTVGALGLGVVSDRWLRRRRPPMIAGGLIFLASWLVLVLWPGGHAPIALTVGAIFLACAGGAANLLCLALAKESNPTAAAGLAMGSANGGILGAALLQPLIGAVLDLGWQGEMLAGARAYGASAYQLGFAAFVALGVLALGAVLVATESHCQDL